MNVSKTVLKDKFYIKETFFVVIMIIVQTLNMDIMLHIWILNLNIYKITIQIFVLKIVLVK